MPRPIPVPIRQAMFRLWQKGRAARQIAESLGLPCSTVRRLLQRFRLHGTDGLSPDYWHPSVAEALPSEPVQTAMSLRREHPTWGAGLIRVQLVLEAPERPVPSERTIQRWFVRAGLSQAPAGRPPRSRLDRATAPHETWQMDAKKHIRIKTREEVSWLRLIDECSGAVLWTAVFPPRGLAEGPPRGRANTAPPGLGSLGIAWPLPGRQRLALGLAGRLPYRAVVVDDRLGYRHALEQPASPPRERGRRSSVPKGHPPAGASRGHAERPRNCSPAWSEWTGCTARSTRTGSAAVVSKSSRAWCIPVDPTIRHRSRRSGSGPALPST